MTYYIFNTEEEALLAEQQIISNVRDWITTNVPDALSSDGSKLRGRNAKTGEFVDVYTTRWAIPQQITDGRWVFPKPTPNITAPIPVEIFLSDVIANEITYNPNWFSSNEILA